MQLNIRLAGYFVAKVSYCVLVSFLFQSHMIVAGYYGFTFDVRVSDSPSYIRSSDCISITDNNSSNRQWICTKLGMSIDIEQIWFGIANGQISLIFDIVI